MDTMTLAIILFAVTYILLLVFSKYRAFIALISAIAFILAGVLPFDLKTIFFAIDWNVIICLGLFIIGLLREVIVKKRGVIAIQALKEIDYFTLLLLASLFVVIEGIKTAGVVDAIGKLIGSIGSGNIFLVLTIVVWASVSCAGKDMRSRSTSL